MKRMLFTVVFVFLTSNAAWAQFAPSKENLRGLKGVRLIVMYGHCPSRDISNCAQGLEEGKRPEVLKMLEADTTAKLQNAGIPLFPFNDESERTEPAKLIVMVTLDVPNGFVHPLVTEVKLIQRVRLIRDPSIETHAVTWSHGGVGGPKLEIPMIRRQVAGIIDRFIQDHLAVNSSQSAGLSKEKPNNPKR